MASGSGAGSQSSVGDSEGRAVDPRYPLWAYVEKIAGSSGCGGGNAKFRCNFCNKVYPGSYRRVRHHLLQITKKDVGTCDKIPHSSFEQLCKEDRTAVRQQADAHVARMFYIVDLSLDELELEEEIIYSLT